MTKPLPPASERKRSGRCGSPSSCSGAPRRRGPKKNSKGSTIGRRGAASKVAARIDTTAGSTASARSAKPGTAGPAPAGAATSTGPRAPWPGAVSSRPPAKTIPKTTAPTTRSRVAD
jgi:hypothetical protein